MRSLMFAPICPPWGFIFLFTIWIKSEGLNFLFRISLISFYLLIGSVKTPAFKFLSLLAFRVTGISYLFFRFQPLNFLIRSFLILRWAVHLEISKYPVKRFLKYLLKRMPKYLWKCVYLSMYAITYVMPYMYGITYAKCFVTMHICNNMRDFVQHCVQ